MTTDVDTAEEISKMTGEKTIVTNSRNGGVLSFDKNITETLEQVPVVRYDDLMRLKLGETLVIKPMHRQDLQGNKIVSFPILNIEEMGMKFKYEYLNDVFSNKLSMREIYVKNSFNEIELKDLKVDFEEEMVDLIKNRVQQIAEENARKDILREEVRKALEKEKDKEQLKDKENKGTQLRKKVKVNISNMLSGLLTDDEMVILNGFTNERDLVEFLNMLYDDGRFNETIFNKINNYINE